MSFLFSLTFLIHLLKLMFRFRDTYFGADAFRRNENECAKRKIEWHRSRADSFAHLGDWAFEWAQARIPAITTLLDIE